MRERIKCAQCGCELTWKELWETHPLCFVCDRNRQDRADAHKEREWKYPEVEDMNQ